MFAECGFETRKMLQKIEKKNKWIVTIYIQDLCIQMEAELHAKKKTSRVPCTSKDAYYI